MRISPGPPSGELGPKAAQLELDILIPCGFVTAKAVAWGGKAPELFHASQEAIRHAVQKSSHRQRLQSWLEGRTRLSLHVEFHLSVERSCKSDLGSLLADLFKPLVERAFGPRAAGRPIPQTKDAFFWRMEAIKFTSEDEKTVVRIRPLESDTA